MKNGRSDESTMENEIYLDDLIRIFKRRWLLIAICLAASVALTILATALSPKVYLCESQIALPIRPTGPYPVVTLTCLSDVGATKLLITSIWQQMRQGEFKQTVGEKVLADIISIKADDVRGTEKYVKLTIKVRNDPKQALVAANAILATLRENRHIKSLIEIELVEVKRDLAKAEATRTESQRLIRSSRQLLGFNPVDMDLAINELKSRSNQMENRRKLLQNYEFIEEPHVFQLNPRTTVKAFLAALVGLLVGCTVAFIIDQKGGARQGAVPRT
jgi:hypothetical protein